MNNQSDSFEEVRSILTFVLFCKFSKILERIGQKSMKDFLRVHYDCVSDLVKQIQGLQRNNHSDYSNFSFKALKTKTRFSLKKILTCLNLEDLQG